LLKLARDQKVDLTRISILALAEQYLAFIEAARRLRLEIAADYLVMAAWLAFLKSRLLLPEEEADGEPSGEELAAVLAHRLAQLEAMRAAGRRLMALARLGVHVFPRGMPEPMAITTHAVWDASLYDLLSAYAALRLRGVADTMQLRQRHVFSLQDTRERLMRLMGYGLHWAPLDSYLLEYLVQPELRRTARASALRRAWNWFARARCNCARARLRAALRAAAAAPSCRPPRLQMAEARGAWAAATSPASRRTVTACIFA
jgi:segregation and condensation protein A